MSASLLLYAEPGADEFAQCFRFRQERRRPLHDLAKRRARRVRVPRLSVCHSLVSTSLADSCGLLGSGGVHNHDGIAIVDEVEDLTPHFRENI